MLRLNQDQQLTLRRVYEEQKEYMHSDTFTMMLNAEAQRLGQPVRSEKLTRRELYTCSLNIAGGILFGREATFTRHQIVEYLVRQVIQNTVPTEEWLDLLDQHALMTFEKYQKAYREKCKFEVPA